MRKRAKVWLPPSHLTPNPTPIIGKKARRQIEEIRSDDRRLAKRLTRKIVDMLDEGLLRYAELIPDRNDIGPRFLVDLLAGYVAVYWVVGPPGQMVPVIWVEQVKLRERFEAELTELAPDEPDDEE